MTTNKDLRTYHDEKVLYVRMVYVIAFLLWLFVIYGLGLYKVDAFGLFILFIPFIFFTIAYLSVPYLCRQVEFELFKANFLSVGLLLGIPLISILEKNYSGKMDIKPLIILAIVFTLCALIDIWLPINYLSVAKHTKSIFQMLAITLMIFSLYIYYDDAKKKPKLLAVQ